MDWLAEVWARVVPDDLKEAPEGFTDRDIDTCFFVSACWEGMYGRWAIDINTRDRKGYISAITFDGGKLNYPRNQEFILDSDLAWFDYLLEIRRLKNMSEEELFSEFGINDWWLERHGNS